jgi:DNA-directed RNA polymerase subunit RPC12/RpoP
MPISFACSGCGHVINAPDARAGTRAKCPRCGAALKVPKPHRSVSQASAAPIAPAPSQPLEPATAMAATMQPPVTAPLPAPTVPPPAPNMHACSKCGQKFMAPNHQASSVFTCAMCRRAAEASSLTAVPAPTPTVPPLQPAPPVPAPAACPVPQSGTMADNGDTAPTTPPQFSTPALIPGGAWDGVIKRLSPKIVTIGAGAGLAFVIVLCLGGYLLLKPRSNQYQPLPGAAIPGETVNSETGPIKVGAIEVTLKSAEYKTWVMVQEGTRNEGFLVFLTVANTHETKQFRFAPWWTVKNKLRLTDNFGNQYLYKTIPSYGYRELEQDRSVNLNAGRSYEDLLVFEEPAANAQFLTLELPGENVGRGGPIRFRITKPVAGW